MNCTNKLSSFVTSRLVCVNVSQEKQFTLKSNYDSAVSHIVNLNHSPLAQRTPLPILQDNVARIQATQLNVETKTALKLMHFRHLLTLC